MTYAARDPGPAAAETGAAPGAGGAPIWLTALCTLSTLALIAVVWALPRPVGDVYVALAGGRDVLAGRLGAPDDWAFTTTGRVWIDQNWGSDVLFYAVFAAFGESGLLALKAVLLAGIAAATTFACRARGARPPLSFLVPAAALAAGWSFIDLRPNLLSLVLAPLVLALLFRRDRGWRSLAAAVAVVWLWANLHGGFVVGVMLLALRAASVLAASTWRHGLRAGLAGAAPAALATVVAVAGAGVLSPFGVTNLTHPFVVATSPVWRQVNEWIPLWTRRASFGSAREWSLMLLVLAGVAATRLALARRAGRARVPRAPGALADALLDVALAVVVIAMGVAARRFVPLGLILLAPALCRQLDALLDPRRTSAAIAVVALALLVPPLRLVAPLAARYRADSPLYPHDGVFGRMVGRETLAPGVVEFVRDNGIAGRVFNAWPWEGYLHWRAPELALFVGGRAQQVYPERAFIRWRALLQAGAHAGEALRALGVPLVMVPDAQPYALLVRSLVRSSSARFAWIYYDGARAVLADATAPATRDLVRRAASGDLRYPDPAVAVASRALALASPAVGAEPVRVRDALIDAGRIFPAAEIYLALGDLAAGDPSERGAIAEALGAEDARLAAESLERPGGLRLLEARRALNATASRLSVAAGDGAQAARRAATAQRLSRERRALMQRWGWGDPPGA